MTHSQNLATVFYSPPPSQKQITQKHRVFLFTLRTAKEKNNKPYAAVSTGSSDLKRNCLMSKQKSVCCDTNVPTIVLPSWLIIEAGETQLNCIFIPIYRDGL